MLHNILRYSFVLFILLSFQNKGESQIAFGDSTHLLEFDYLTSGVAMCISDMNGDGLDDIIRLSDADTLKIEYQQPDGTYVGIDLGNADGQEEWSMSIADVDRNGFNDVITGGNQQRIKLFKANKLGSSFSIDTLPTVCPVPQLCDIYVQATNFADINNDGHIDFFACNDDGLSSVYENDGSGNFLFDTDTSLINTKSSLPMGLERLPDDANSGNYGSVWTDYDWDGDLDLYISKCRQGVDTTPTDGRRVNLLFQNDGSENYTEVASSAGLIPFAQSWATSFADFDNDGDLDCFVINHFSTSKFYWNNGDGTFTDVTSSTGVVSDLDFLGFGIQVILEDFDNDTYVDLYVTTLNGRDIMLHNNSGDTTFTEIDFALDTGGSGAQSAAAGDLNHDGFVDLLIGFAAGFNQPNPFDKTDKLQLNLGNSNHFLNVELTGTQSNINGIGAGIEIYGDFGKQIREVRAGESYGIQNSMSRNFGLGSYTTVDSLKVMWPSGTIDTHENIAADQFLKLREGCTGDLTAHVVNNLNNDGPGSLRQSIREACDSDTIYFDFSISEDTIKLTSGEIVIDKSIIISGLNEAETLISGNSMSRIFNILPGNDVVIANLALIDAQGGGIDGSAIYNAGNLSIQNLYMAGNYKDGVPQAINNKGIINVLLSSVIIQP